MAEIAPSRSLVSLKPIGVLGGTFDPIHYGHLRLAQEMAQALGLDSVRFIPAGAPYHRAATADASKHRALTAASTEQRLAMVRLAIAGNERFALDTRDIERSGATYTYDTLLSLRGELGEQVALVVLLGADAFALFETWHRWGELFDLCHFAVAQRPGAQAWRSRIGAPLAEVLRARECADAALLGATPAGRVFIVAMTPPEISGTAIRAQLRDGASPRYLLPDAVLDYILANKLYVKEVNES